MKKLIQIGSQLSSDTGAASVTAASRDSAQTAPMSSSSLSSSSSVTPSVHSISTGANENCGRFGDGFHGGKHLFVCPNRPFPVGVKSHFP